MVRRFLRFVAALALVGLATTVSAQETGEDAVPAMLIADRVEILGDGKLVASGAVEAMQGDYRLKASKITYDPETETIDIVGPIILQQGENSVMLADSGQLSTDLKEGLLDSARIVLDQQLQITAVEANRVGGRYTQLYNTVASSCSVCAARPIPIWQIRARRVVHDELEKQIYFDHAFFEVMGIPIIYLPQLRLPDPTLERATGFLTPYIRNSSELGFGIKTPWFWAIDDHRDLTLTPYLAVDYTATLELRYRQAFRRGYTEFNGAISYDNLTDENPRGYVFGYGWFSLPRGFRLAFDIEAASDADYLDVYDYLNKDRLESAISLTRVRRDKMFWAEVIRYESLRSNESNLTQPYRVTDVTWRRRMDAPVVGGVLTFGMDLHGHQRRSAENVIGRDVGRLTAEVDWWRDWIGPWGLKLGVQTAAFLDHTVILDDSNFESPVTQVQPYGVIDLRWPWIRQGARASHVIEPVAQIVWSPEIENLTPNDESTQLEFDGGNLFSLSRFPAYDEFESGLRANLGLSYSLQDMSGWTMTATAGRILRAEDLGQFDGFRVFEGQTSDWLAELRFEFLDVFSFNNRATFDGDLGLDRAEIRFGLEQDTYEIASSFIWLEPSSIENRGYKIREWNIAADWDVSERIQTSIDLRYDLEFQRAARTRLGLEYRTECVDYGLGILRRYTEIDQQDPSTDITFQIDLAGVSGAGTGRSRPRRLGCRG
ncbi:LPS-assembly protein LptD [Tropicimonas sp. IMCC6043]|uniref:LPS-assembly protein LptD n=1 Tax=Tropicimonas sp. IMCC6043 TaxID=2510645 RepID=UPI00101B7571|nr:LPS assembly protein LptD [Tropicimonas sp. IMCC6043]RYH11215.1 LPS-assembly protein LptD [Tropicimonas sp. IMCC6043]